MKKKEPNKKVNSRITCNQIKNVTVAGLSFVLPFFSDEGIFTQPDFEQPTFSSSRIYSNWSSDSTSGSDISISIVDNSVKKNN